MADPKNSIFTLFQNVIYHGFGALRVMRGYLPAEQSNDLTTLGQVQDLIASISSGFLIKGFGNTLPTVENGDYQIVTNSDNTCVIQFRKADAWDTANETELATPS
jgi:hypothetical protein